MGGVGRVPQPNKSPDRAIRAGTKTIISFGSASEAPFSAGRTRRVLHGWMGWARRRVPDFIAVGGVQQRRVRDARR
jgi:hypothetical protein